jgi:hypothetical protein
MLTTLYNYFTILLMAQNEQINIRVDRETKERIVKIAKEQRTTIAAKVKRWIWDEKLKGEKK